MASNKYKNQSTTMCKIENWENCALPTSGVDSLKDLSKVSICDPGELYILKRV